MRESLCRFPRNCNKITQNTKQLQSDFQTFGGFFFSRLKVLADFSLEPLGFSPVVHLPPSPSCPAKGAGPVYLFGRNHFQMSTSIRVKTIEEKIH